MQHHVLRADHRRALQFTPKGVDRLAANDRILGCQVDEIVGVNGQWIKVKMLAGRLEKFYLQRIGSTSSPHPRACREDLEGVSSQFGSFQRSSLERSGGKG